MPTLKEQLETANATIATLTLERDQAISVSEAATAQIEVLKETGNRLELVIKGNGEAFIKLETQSSATISKLIADFAAEQDKNTILVGELESAVAQVYKLEGEAKTADTRSREIAARNGIILPDKQHRAGDQTTDAPITGTPKQRLGQIFEPKN